MVPPLTRPERPRWGTLALMDASPIIHWLLEPTTGTLTHGAFMDALCERLVDAGVPLSRASISVRTRHPEIFVLNGQWRPGTGTVVNSFTRSGGLQNEYEDSPIHAVHQTGRPLRVPLVRDDLPYPVCRDLRAEGMTDYAIHPMHSSRGGDSYASWATSAPSGFPSAAIDLLDAIAPTLALRLDAANGHLATHQLLEVYLGTNAARRVLDGTVERGSGERIRAAIWFCDLRGYTALSDRTDVDEVIEILDDYFGLVAGPIERHGGEILKFIGDAVLAVFPVGDAPSQACTCALRAANEALATTDQLPEGLSFGIALHLGEVFFGNIGAARRLDFTVIGPAVNEASRVEGMCKPLGRSLLLTREFATEVTCTPLVSLGEHALRGVDRAQELFTVAPDTTS